MKNRDYKVGDKIYITRPIINKDHTIKMGQVCTITDTGKDNVMLAIQYEDEDRKGMFSWRSDYIKTAVIVNSHCKLHTPVEKLNNQRLKELLTKLKQNKL